MDQPGWRRSKRKLGVTAVYDLSATPFFLRGSGYREGTLFPWTVSDFSLMDAIECGIVKLPRIPVADNLPGAELPIYRNLWEHIGKDMPKIGRAKAGKRQPAGAAERAANRPLRAVWPLREDVRAMGQRGHRGAAGLHRGLQQHLHLRAGLRMDLRLRARWRGRAEPLPSTAT